MRGPDNGPPEEAGLRVSDADRDAAVDQLAGHFQQGRLDLTEFQDRMDRAVRARTRGDLAGLLADLPQPVEAVPPAAPGRHWPVPPPVLAVLAVAGGLILASTFGAAAHGYWAGGHWAGGHASSGWWAPWWALWWLIPAAIVALRVTWWRRARAAGRWR